ncbi:MAG: hypothetical protein ABI422_00210 [Sphingomicrobium sp.]
MSRFVILILVAVLVVGALIFLSTQAREVPTRTIETDVSQGANAR